MNMTDRLKGLVVVLDKDIRVDDAEEIINAIKMIKGVADVQGSVANYNDYMNRSRVDREWKERLWKMIREETKSD
jgi:hypothetical protein